jgi:hypothetical protein
VARDLSCDGSFLGFVSALEAIFPPSECE